MKKKIKKSLSIPLVLLVITGGVNPSYTLANGAINYSPKDPENANEVANLKKIQALYPNGFKYGDNIKWVNGVKAPDASNFKIINEYTFADTPYAFYTVTDENANAGNWYDINKKFYGASDQNLCYAAVSGNMLHWWLNVNRDYVNRFLSIYPENDKRVYLDKEVTKLHNYLDSYKNQEESNIFEDFTKYFRFKNHGGWTDAINDFFINGYKPNYSSYENSERNWDKNNLDPRGGYFSKVFGSEILSTRNMANNKYSFSNLLKQYLDEGKAVGVAYRIGKNVGPYHIISLWGAEFDNDGYVTAIYVTDSDDGKSKYEAIDDTKQIKKGLFRYRVTYDKDNVPRISETTDPDNDRGGYVSYLYGLKTGEETWKEFFKKAEVMQKEEALKEAKKSLENLINDAKSTDIEKLSDAIKKAEDKTKEPRATEQDFKEAKKELEKALEEYKKSKEDETNKVETGKISGEENSSSRSEDKTPIEEGETEQPQSGDSIAEDKKEDNQSDTPSSTEKEAKEENTQPESDKNNVEENTSREDASSNESSTITEEGRSESENKAEEPKLAPEKDSKTESEPKVETEEKSETSEDKKEEKPSVEKTEETTVPENASTETNKEVVPKANVEQPKIEEETVVPSVESKEENIAKPEGPKANVEQPKEETKVEETTETTKPSVEPKVKSEEKVEASEDKKEPEVSAETDKKEETPSVEKTEEITVPGNASTETNKEVVPNTEESITKPSVPKANVAEPKVETKVEETTETTKPSVEPTVETETAKPSAEPKVESEEKVEASEDKKEETPSVEKTEETPVPENASTETNKEVVPSVEPKEENIVKPEAPKANAEQPKEEIKVEETTETTKPFVEPKVEKAPKTEKETTKPEEPKANVEQPRVEIKVEGTTETTEPSVEPKIETTTKETELTRSIVAQVGDSKVEVLIKDENNANYNVQVKDITEEYKEAVFSKISEKVDSIKIFDIDLLDSSKENIVKTDKDRTVRISLVENLENKTVNIYYVDDKTGELTLIPSKVENNTVVFSVNHFSKYAVTVSENKQQQKLPNTGGLDNSTSSLGLITIMITLGLVSRRNKIK